MLGSLGFFKLVQTFWGLLVVSGLGGYSLYEAIDDEPAAEPAYRVASAAVEPTATASPVRPTPIGGFPTPSPVTIFLACNGQDGDSIRYYVHSPGGNVVLRVDVDRQLIIDVIAGDSSRFGANPILVQTACMRGLLRSGAFP